MLDSSPLTCINSLSNRLPFLGVLKNAGVYVYPLVLKETEQVVGIVTLNNAEETCKRIEVGYFLLSGYWKNGYIREILGAIVKFLKEHSWHRIEATVYSGNEASQRVLEVCGFTREGVLRDKYFIHGKYHDDIAIKQGAYQTIVEQINFNQAIQLTEFSAPSA